MKSTCSLGINYGDFNLLLLRFKCLPAIAPLGNFSCSSRLLKFNDELLGITTDYSTKNKIAPYVTFNSICTNGLDMIKVLHSYTITFYKIALYSACVAHTLGSNLFQSLIYNHLLLLPIKIERLVARLRYKKSLTRVMRRFLFC